MMDEEHHKQHNHRRFRAAHKHKLHSEERKRFQPASAILELATFVAPRQIVDIGVGTGYFALPLLQHLPEARVTGLDVSSEMLQTFEARATSAGVQDRITMVLHDLDEQPWPLAPKSFDLALAMSLTHEVADRNAFAREVRRILRDNGRILVVDWDPDAKALHGPPTDHRLAPGQVISTMTQQGLVLEDQLPLYEDFYSLVFTKG